MTTISENGKSKNFFHMPHPHLPEFARRGYYIMVERRCADGMVEGVMFKPTILAASIRLALHGRLHE